MANKKKPEPVKKAKAVPKKKPEPVKKAKAVPKKKPEPAKKAKPVPKKKPEPAQPSAEQARARIGAAEILRRVLIVLLALGICCSAALAVVSYKSEQLQQKIELSYSGVLQRDSLLPIDFEEGQVRDLVQNMQRHGQTRAFTYFCNNTLQLNADSMSGYILFGNPAENDCTLVLSVLDENGELIYRSDGVEPGCYISQIRPFYALENGTYKCTAYVYGFTGTDRDFVYDCVGVQYSDLTVKVGGSS